MAAVTLTTFPLPVVPVETFEQPVRTGRHTVRGDDGRFYTAFIKSKNGSTVSLYVTCYSMIAVGSSPITTHWTNIVRDLATAPPTSRTMQASFGGTVPSTPGIAYTLALNDTGANKHIMVASTEFSPLDIPNQTKAQFHYLNLATPGAFTAGNTFTIGHAYWTGFSSLLLFGRAAGVGDIHCIYVDWNGQSGSTAALKQRTITAVTDAWSAATTVNNAAAWGDLACNADNLAGVRDASGNIHVVVAPTIPGLAAFGHHIAEYYKWNGTAWSAKEVLFDAGGSDPEQHLIHGVAVDVIGTTVTALIIEDAVGIVGHGSYGTCSPRIRKAIRAAGVWTSSIVVPSFTQKDISANWYIKQRGLFALDVWLDASGQVNAIWCEQLWTTGNLNGQSFTWYREESGGTFIYGVNGLGNHLMCASVPKDRWLFPVAANIQQGLLATFLDKNGADVVLVTSTDYQMGLWPICRQTRNCAQVPHADTLPVFNFFQLRNFASVASRAGSTLQKSASNARDFHQTYTWGKSKVLGQARAFVQAVVLVVDTLSKWKTSNARVFTQAVTPTRVRQMNVLQFLNFQQRVLDAGPTSTAQVRVFTQTVKLTGNLTKGASNARNFAQGVGLVQPETCETSYSPVPAIPDDPNAVMYVQFGGPYPGPYYSIVLPRPEFGDGREIELQNEVNWTRLSNPRIYTRSPLPTRLRLRFVDLTRRQALFFESWRLTFLGREVQYRDHHGHVWHGYILNQPAWVQKSFERVDVAVDFEGALVP